MSKCVRCGRDVKGGTKGSRCPECLKKLNRNRKNPNRHEHFDKLASDALKRQRGQKSSKQKEKHSGLGTTQKIIKKMKEAYKKYGTSTTLSPDRRDNSKGYSASNIRAIPKILNRGRHVADAEKVKKWKDKVKKNNIDLDDLQKSCINKAYDLGENAIAIALECRPGFLRKLLK
jgi:hypothetical protein